MSIRLQINPEDFKRAKLVKPGWYPTLIKDIQEELAKDKTSMNVVLDVENADTTTEYAGVPAKHWFTEKFVQGVVSFAKAMNPGLDEAQVATVPFDDYKGKYVYAKWATNRGKDGNDPPRNAIEDWAPLPKNWAHLNDATALALAGADLGGFDK